MTDFLKTQFMVPSWLIRAISALAGRDLMPGTPEELLQKQMLVPSLTASELNSFLEVLNLLQGQILAGSSVVKINLQSHKKGLSTMRREHRFQFERFVQMLPGCSLISDALEGVFQPIQLFSKQEWRIDGEDQELILNLSPLGDEILLGYCDAFQQANRKAQGLAQFSKEHYTNKPLSIGKSIWLDLNTFERAIYLNIESATQWQDTLMNFRGNYGLCLDKMFDGLVPPRPKFQVPFLDRLHALQGIGRKLVDHGLFTQMHESDDYLVFEDEERGNLRIIWHACENGQAMDSLDYKVACWHYFFHKFVKSRGGVSGRYLVPLTSGKAKSMVDDFWSLVKKSDFKMGEPLGIANSLVCPIQLFFEWMIRQFIEDEHFRLPERIVNSDLGWLVSEKNSGPLKDRINQFISLLTGHFSVMMQSELSIHSISHPEFLNKERIRRLSLKVEPASLGLRSQKISTRKIKNPEVDVTGWNPAMPHKVSLNNPKKVGEEIVWLRKHEPNEYQILREAFIRSLDEGKRKLILDVQRRLKPAIFDEHLKHTLTKFVMENPSLLRKVAPTTQ